jgi:hypothetical protein
MGFFIRNFPEKSDYSREKLQNAKNCRTIVICLNTAEHKAFSQKLAVKNILFSPCDSPKVA